MASSYRFPASLVSPSARSPHPASYLPPLCKGWWRGSAGGKAVPPAPSRGPHSKRWPHPTASLPPLCKGWWRGSAGGMVAPPASSREPPARDALIPPPLCLPFAKGGGAVAPEVSFPRPPLAGPVASDGLIPPLPYLPCIPQSAMPSSRRFPASLLQRVVARQRRRKGRSPCLLPGLLSRAPLRAMPHPASSLPPVCKGWWRGSAGSVVPPAPSREPPARDALILPHPCLPCAKGDGAAAPEGWSLPWSPRAGPQRAMCSSRRFPASLFTSGQHACAPSMATPRVIGKQKTIPRRDGFLLRLYHFRVMITRR